MPDYEILGQPVTLPVRVRDATAATVLYDVDASAAQALVPAAFEVVESAPGRATFALALVDYRDNDLGAYLEVGFMFFVRPAGGGGDGTFITHLPVDGEFTCAAGRQIWGFPKTVERIDARTTADGWRWRLEMDGEPVLDVTVPSGGADELPEMDLTAYTLLDGRPHATPFSQGGYEARVTTDADVRLDLGAHPLAKELASLGLPARPVLTTWIGQMQASFGEARPL